MKEVFDMNDFKYNVLLFSDGSHQAFSAAVYAATLLKKIPNMYLTILQVQESDDGSQKAEYSWLELRPKNKRYYWGCSTGEDFNWINSWPASPKSDWVKGVLDESELGAKNQYDKILSKTNEIFMKRRLNIKHQVICTNTSISEKIDISGKADAIIDYVTKNPFELIIMGSRGRSTFKGFLVGSLAHTVLNKSPLPVLLIKKLPQDYIDSFLSDTES